MGNLSELKRKSDEYNARLKAKGIAMLAYRSACCSKTLESRAAPVGQRWDTLATCPECGALYMKVTTESRVQALIPEAA